MPRLATAQTVSVLAAAATVLGVLAAPAPGSVLAAEVSPAAIEASTFPAPSAQLPAGSIAGDARRIDVDLPAPLERAWIREDLLCPTQPVTDDARVFTVVNGESSPARHLIALDAVSGRTLWRSADLTAPTDAYAQPWGLAYDEGRVFVHRGMVLIALDARTGAELWRRGTQQTGDLLAFGGGVFLSDGDLTGFDAATGGLRFRIRADAVVSDGQRLYGADRLTGVVQAMDPETGRVLWSDDSVYGPVPFSWLVQDGVLHSPAGRFDADSGARLGDAGGTFALDGDLALVSRQVVSGGPLEAHGERPDGRRLWGTTREEAVFAGSQLYRFGRTVWAQDRTTGRKVWESEPLPQAERCAHPNTGDVLTAGAGALISAGPAHLLAFRRPRVALHAVEPDAGPAGEQVQVRLRGRGLAGVTAVRFGTRTTRQVQVLSDRELLVRTPALPGGQVRVVAFGLDGRSTALDTVRYRAETAPAVLQVSPARGPTGGGSLVTLTGSGLAAVESVTVAGQPAPLASVVSDQQLRVRMPPMPAGPVEVVVRTAGGATGSAGFTAVSGPASAAADADGVNAGHTGAAPGPLGQDLTPLWQRTAPITSTPLLAEGKLFTVECDVPQDCRVVALDRDTGTELWLHEGRELATITDVTWADGRLLVAEKTRPVGADVTALDADTGAVLWRSFPLAGERVVADGDVVVSHGPSGVVGVGAANGVRRFWLRDGFDAAVFSAKVYLSRRINGDLREVSSRDRSTGTPSWTLPVNSIYSNNPLWVGPDGVLFSDDQHLHQVDDQIGTTEAVGPPVQRRTAVHDGVMYTTGADVVARRLGGEELWRVAVAPNYHYRQPSSPVVADGRLYLIDQYQQVRAHDLRTGAQVWQHAPTDAESFHERALVTAAEQRLVSVTHDRLTVYGPSGPRLIALSTQTASPGQSVTVTGIGLSSVTDARVGTQPAAWTRLTDSTMRVTVPADAPAGRQPVALQTDTTSTPISDGAWLTVHRPARILDVQPAAGPLTGGQVVTITGSGLTDTAAVRFGSASGTDLQVLNDSTVQVTTPGGTDGQVAVEIVEDNGVASPPNDAARYHYRNRPTVSTVIPDVGLEQQPQQIAISGSDLSGVERVWFGEAWTTQVQVTGDDRLVVTAPPLPPGAHPITVTGPGGRSLQISALYVVAPDPVAAAPTDVIASGEDGTLRVRWTAVPGEHITGYRVLTEPAGRAIDVTVPATTTAVDLPQATPHQLHSVVVVTHGRRGPGGSVRIPDVHVRDLEPPTVTIDSRPAAIERTGRAAVAFTGTDPRRPDGDLDIICRLDNNLLRPCSSPLELTVPDGRHELVISARDSAGNDSEPVSVAWTVDSRPPVPSTAALPTFTLASRVTVRYSATDSGTGVADYDLRYRYASHNSTYGSFAYPSAWQRITATSASMAVTAGRTYCFSTRARDHAGNLSPWSSESCTATALDDRALIASGPWIRDNPAGYYHRTRSRTTSTTATLKLESAQVSRLALVATTCPSCGAVAVYVGGRHIGTISLKSSTTRTQVLLPLPALSLQSARIGLKPANSGIVEVDGLAVSRR